MAVQNLRIITSSARKFINMGSLPRLWNLVKNFHPSEIADLMEHLISRERLLLINVIFEKDKEKAAEVLSELEPEDAADILENLPVEQISEIFQVTPTDDVPPMLELLPDEMKEQVLAMMAEKSSINQVLLIRDNPDKRITGATNAFMTERAGYLAVVTTGTSA